MKYATVLALTALLVLAACTQGSSSSSRASEFTGTKGMAVEFLPGTPPSKLAVGFEDEPITITVEVKNLGTYPQIEDANLLDQARLYLSGFDNEIIVLDTIDEYLDAEFLDGVSSLNPQGSVDAVTFEGEVVPSNIIITQYEPRILATLCYPYQTKFSPSVCIDPFPHQDTRQKVCTIGTQTFSGQGAPIAVTKIEQEASTSKLTFRITIENKGDGDVIHINELDKCNPYSAQPLKREHFNRVELLRATVGFEELECKPLDGSMIRMVNGKGSIFCTLDNNQYNDVTSAYQTPLNLELRYGYRTSSSTNMLIEKIPE